MKPYIYCYRCVHTRRSNWLYCYVVERSDISTKYPLSVPIVSWGHLLIRNLFFIAFSGFFALVPSSAEWDMSSDAPPQWVEIVSTGPHSRAGHGRAGGGNQAHWVPTNVSPASNLPATRTSDVFTLRLEMNRGGVCCQPGLPHMVKIFSTWPAPSQTKWKRHILDSNSQAPSGWGP